MSEQIKRKTGLKKKNTSGITLVEVVFSILILLLAISFILSTFVSGKMGVLRAKHRIEARNILQAKLEELKNTPYNNVVSSGPVAVVMNFGYDSIEATSDDLVGNINVQVVDQNGYKEVTVLLSWHEMGWGRRVSVEEKVTSIINIWSIYQ